MFLSARYSFIVRGDTDDSFIDRICIGRFFAEDAVWLAIASMLHLTAIRDPTSKRDVSHVSWSSGLVRYAFSPYTCETVIE